MSDTFCFSKVCDYFISIILFSFSRLSYLSNNMKRAKDNSGTGYSYGSAIASLGNPPVKSTSKYSKGQLCSCKEQGIMPSSPAEVQNVHILRTTAINDTVLDSPVVEMVSKVKFIL